MKCPKCGYTLPDDSEFCQYCGDKIESKQKSADCSADDLMQKDNTQRDSINEVLPSARTKNDDLKKDFQADTDSRTRSRQRFCKLCGAVIDLQTKKCTFCGKQNFRFPKKAFFIASVFALFLALAGLNVYQYMHYDHIMKSNVATISKLRNKAYYYSVICDFLSSGNVGYAAENFKSSDSIIIVKKTETNKKITLTAYWSKRGTVLTSNSSFQVAGIEFDNDNWSRTTTMTINPHYEGITIITFSNNIDAKTFKIMIIVTE